ncbi:MAG: sugar kinase [Trebonia sp.]
MEVTSSARAAGPVAVLGEPLVAFIAEDGPLPTARRYAAHVTGAEANLAIALARLGHSVEFIGLTGQDGLGTLIRRTLRGEGVGVAHLASAPQAATGVLVREAARQGPAEVIYHRAQSAGSLLSPADLPADEGFFDQAAILYVSGITLALSATARDAVTVAITRANQADTLIALDVNMRRRLWTPLQARAAFAAVVPDVDIVFADDAELAVLDDGEPAAVIARLHERGVGTVVRKRGQAGAEVHRAGETPLLLATAADVSVRDTVGAGDAFAAGYLSALLDGEHGAGELLRRAHLLGAYAVSALGDTTALPERWRMNQTDTAR